MGCNCSIFKRYSSIEDVQLELRHKGIDDIILTLGIDYTKSNRFNGRVSNNGKNLHDIQENKLNPYQEALSLVTSTLESMIPYNSIYMLGFSDAYSQDRTVFPLSYRNNKNLNILENISLNMSEQVLETYKKITPKIILCSPSTFTPLIDSAINIYKIKKKEQILVIFTDSDLINYQKEVNKISETMLYPISIICIGIGDSQFTVLENLNKTISNFYFVDFYKIRQIENEGKRAYKMFEELPKIFNIQKKYFNKDIIYTDINPDIIKPIHQYFM